MHAPKALPVELRLQNSLRHITTLQKTCQSYLTHIEPFKRVDIQEKTKDGDLLSVIAIIREIVKLKNRIHQSTETAKRQLQQYENVIKSKKALMTKIKPSNEVRSVVSEHETRLLPMYRAELTSVCLVTNEQTKHIHDVEVSTQAQIHRLIALRHVNGK